MTSISIGIETIISLKFDYFYQKLLTVNNSKKMDRETLQKKSILAEQQRIKDEIKQLTEKSKELTVMFDDHRMVMFDQFYHKGAKEVLENYAKRLATCCGQSDGYSWWLPGEFAKYRPTYCHCYVTAYKEAQPSQEELDAYWAIFGNDMSISKDKFTVRWGN